MNTIYSQKLSSLSTAIKNLYSSTEKELPFHGLPHIEFVVKKTRVFATSLGADDFLAESAAWIHDLNYFVKTTYNSPEEGKELWKKYLAEAGYSEEEIETVCDIVMEINTWSRDITISKEAQALSDADMLFKCLPITPIVFTPKYMQETKQSLGGLADTVIKLQRPLLDKGIYFYSNEAKEKYLTWAEQTVHLFSTIAESLEDADIQELVR